MGYILTSSEHSVISLSRTTTMALACHLNDLSISFSQGLIDDEEYRLLRQDAFERFSGASKVPMIVPFVEHSPRIASLSPTQFLKPTEIIPSPRMESSNFVNFLKRVTSRKPKDILIQIPTGNSLKRTFIPRILSRRPSIDMSSIRTASSSGTSSRKDASSSYISHPTRPKSPARRVVSPSQSIVDHDIFEDGGPNTTKELRQAITDTQLEACKVLQAFDGLERSAIQRQREQDNYRRPLVIHHLHSTPFPTLNSSMIEVKPNSPKGSRSGKSGNNQPVSSLRSTHTFLKVASSSSLAHSHQGSTSTSGSAQYPPSILLRSKASMPSIVSHVPSTSARKVAFNEGCPSWSTGHLPLRRMASAISVSNDGEGEGDDVGNIQRRRQEVRARYAARLEYLRARLKGAELHEKLLKR